MMSEKMQNEISSIFQVIFNLQSHSGARIVYYVNVDKREALPFRHVMGT